MEDELCGLVNFSIFTNLSYNVIMAFLLRLVGDIHENIHKIDDLKADYLSYDLTILLGDVGFGFGIEHLINEFQSDKLKVLFGNHDCYDTLSHYPHNLGRYGLIEIGGKKIFYVGGAWSIDQDKRLPGYNWWGNEELSFVEIDKCLELWEKVGADVDIVLTHDAPIYVVNQLLGQWPIPTSTSQMLYEMWKIHKPKIWRFGHYHISWRKKISGTDFRCLNINEEEVIEI